MFGREAQLSSHQARMEVRGTGPWVVSIAWAFCVLGACSNAKILGNGNDSGPPSRAEAADAPGIQIQLDGGNVPRCPSTCVDLGANCGPVTDTKCGGVVDCGACAGGMVCGAVVPNVCGTGTPSDADACVPRTCRDQAVTCGPTSDGCNGTLWCGSCSAPQTCGGDPQRPGQCGCTGLCSQVPSCSSDATTTIVGQVYDPAGLRPLFDALVYIPNQPDDPGLKPFPAGITCDVCGATAAGQPLVTTKTDVNGAFVLANVPVGKGIPLVVQLGRWRRQFTVDVTHACASHELPNRLTMPKSHAEGDIPRIAILTGAVDPVECTLRKMGVADSEFTNPGGGGRINLFLANGKGAVGSSGPGAAIDGNTPGQDALFATTGGQRIIDQYDMVILECEGYLEPQSAADLAALRAYADAGGRVFGSDFNAGWFSTNGDFAKAADWTPGPYYGGVAMSPVNIDVVSNPKGESFSRWLEVVGISSPGSHAIASLFPVYDNTGDVVPPTQQWLFGNDRPVHFTFNTPVGAAAANQCGRVVYSDWHANAGGLSYGTRFPAECDPSMSAQEQILEFMLFDLSACVQPYAPLCTPRTCAQLKRSCGPAGDGCGGLLDCGSCASGQICGGGGPGVCGTSVVCVPETCTSQAVECGPAGDGCGHAIDCGQCPTGQICGFDGHPGRCGQPQFIP
jgi:hypothetical protein